MEKHTYMSTYLVHIARLAHDARLSYSARQTRGRKKFKCPFLRLFAERLQARRKRRQHPTHKLSQSCLNPPKFHKTGVLRRFCALASARQTAKVSSDSKMQAWKQRKTGVRGPNIRNSGDARQRRGYYEGVYTPRSRKINSIEAAAARPTSSLYV